MIPMLPLCLIPTEYRLGGTRQIDATPTKSTTHPEEGPCKLAERLRLRRLMAVDGFSIHGENPEGGLALSLTGLNLRQAKQTGKMDRRKAGWICVGFFAQQGAFRGIYQHLRASRAAPSGWTP